MVKVGVNKDVSFFVFGRKQTKRNDIECHHKKCQKEERRIGRLATPNKFCTQIIGGNDSSGNSARKQLLLFTLPKLSLSA